MIILERLANLLKAPLLPTLKGTPVQASHPDSPGIPSLRYAVSNLSGSRGRPDCLLSNSSATESKLENSQLGCTYAGSMQETPVVGPQIAPSAVSPCFSF
eukprot:1154170-Pelagomonas_calceolata.AAC.2